MKIEDFLSRGRDHAIHAEELVRLTQTRSVRELQKRIEWARTHGAVIVSDSKGGGYYLPDCPDDIRRFIITMTSRAKSILAATQSAQRALDALTGQEVIEGWYNNA